MRLKHLDIDTKPPTAEGAQTQKQQELLRQVRQMTPEAIKALPAEQQEQVKLLRQAEQLSR
jgi:hypothetical protein